MDHIRFRMSLDGSQQVQQSATQAASSLDRVGQSGANAAAGLQRADALLGAIKGTLAGISVGALARDFIKTADSVTVLQNSLALATGSAAAAGAAYTQLFGIAQRSRTSFTELGATFASITRAVDGMGISQGRLLKITEAIGNAMAISGGNAGGMQAALTQLGQGLASGTLRGDELNSVLEQTPRLARALADGLGVSVGKLRELGQDGKLTAESVLQALESQSSALAREVGASVTTVSQALTQLGNASTFAVGEIDRVTGSSAALAGVVQGAAQSIEDIARAFRGVSSEAGGTASAFDDGIAVVFEAVTVLGVNVAYVLQQLGKELGGLAAQAVSVATGNFSHAVEIGRMMKEEAAKAREEVDALSERIVRARELRQQTQRLTTSAELFRREELDGMNAAAGALGRVGTAAKQTADQLRAAQREAERQQSVLNAVRGVTDDYAESLQRLVTMRTANRLTDAEYLRQVEALIARQPSSIALTKQQEQAERELARARDEAARLSGRLAESDLQHIEALRGSAEALQLQIDSLRLGEAEMQRLTVATMRAAAADLEWQAGNAGGNALWEERARLLRLNADRTEQLAAVQAAQAGRASSVAAAKEAGAAWDRMADQAGQSLADALMDGGRSAADLIEDYFRTLVLRPVLEVGGQQLASGVLQLIGAATGSAASAGGGTNWLQAAGAANSLYQTYQGGGLAGSAVAAGNYASVYSGAAYGTGFGTQQSAMLAAQEAGMVSQAGGASMAAWAGYAAAVIAAYMGSRSAWEAGYNNENLEGAFRYSPESTFTDLLKIGGMSDRSANIWGGGAVYTKLFGRASPKVMDTGVMGTLSGGGFSGLSFADIQENGGWFRSDKNYTETKEVASSVDMFFDDAAAAILKKAGEYGKALGLPADQLANISTEIRVSLGDDAEKNKQAIIQALAQYGDALVSGFADQVAPLQQYGETVGQTIERVGGALLQVNTVLESMGHSGLQASIGSGKAAAELATLFGGLQNLGTAASSFRSKFYTEAEQIELQSDAVAAAMGKFGLSMPDTREQFRAMVDTILEGGGLLTEAGRRQYAVLMGVADAFDVVATASERGAAAAKKAAEEAADAAQKVADAQIKAAADRMAGLTGALDDVLPGLLSPGEARRYQFDRIGQNLRQQAGLSFSTDQLMAASKQDILAFGRAFVNLSDGASEAEIAFVNAAGALSKLIDESDAAAVARRDALTGMFDGLVAGLRSGVESAYADVDRLISANRQQLESSAEQSLRALDQQASRVTQIYSGLVDSLGSSLQQLTGQLAGDGGRGHAISTLQQALGDLRGGRAIDADQVRAAAGAASRLDPAGFASALEYRRALASTANLIRDVTAAARQQQSSELGAIAAQQVKIEADLQKQLDSLDAQLDQARAAAGSLISIDDGVKTVAGALDRLAAAMGAVKAVEGGAASGGPTGQWVASGGVEVWAATGGAVAIKESGASVDGMVIRGKTGNKFTVAEAIAYAKDRIAADDIAGLHAALVREGIDSASFDAMMGFVPGTSLAEAKRRGLPAFETGTNFVPETGLALIHEGERIIPAAENSALMSMLAEGSRGELAAEVRALRNDVVAAIDALRSQSMNSDAVIASNTGKAARMLDGMVHGYASIAVRVVEDS